MKNFLYIVKVASGIKARLAGLFVKRAKGLVIHVTRKRKDKSDKLPKLMVLWGMD